MPFRVGQYGTRHGHAQGKLRALLGNPDVEVAGVLEPNRQVREATRTQWALSGVRWLESEDDLLGDPDIAVVAVEGRNDESLAMARACVEAGKHLWLDKPAGDDWASFQEVVSLARARGLLIQMGYMFRYHDGFRRVADWARSGLLGEVFAVRAHMSTSIAVPAREVIARHRGGIFYDLAGHMLDQIVWLLGRPHTARAFFRNDASPEVPGFADNTLGVFEFDRALAYVDIAAMETRPMARRFEVYGTRGSAIMEPFEPATEVRLCLDAPREGHAAGAQVIAIAPQTRQELYDRELAALVATLRGEQPPDRSLEHEALVQETLLRATGAL